MINANELRVGNKIIANALHEGKIMTVDGIGKNTEGEKRVIWFLEHNIGEFEEYLEPISLTPEILEKCGFYGTELRLKIGKHDYPEEVLHIVWYEELKLCRLENRGEGFRFAKPILFLHQLQNLYFDLTEKELQVNL